MVNQGRYCYGKRKKVYDLYASRHDAEIDGKGKRWGRRQPPTRARGRERRRSRRRKREKKRERRAAQPPVSKRSRKQRFLFFCWGLFSWGAFSFFSPPRHPFHCVSRFCRDNSLVLFRPVGGHLCPPKFPLVAPSAILRRPFDEIPATP